MFSLFQSFLIVHFLSIPIVETLITGERRYQYSSSLPWLIQLDHYAHPTGLTGLNTSMPMVTSKPDPNMCGACEYGSRYFFNKWGDNIYTYTAAAVELIIDDSTNTTSTSTITNASFARPSYKNFPGANVTGSVATLTLAATTLFV